MWFGFISQVPKFCVKEFKSSYHNADLSGNTAYSRSDIGMGRKLRYDYMGISLDDGLVSVRAVVLTP